MVGPGCGRARLGSVKEVVYTPTLTPGEQGWGPGRKRVAPAVHLSFGGVDPAWRGARGVGARWGRWSAEDGRDSSGRAGGRPWRREGRSQGRRRAATVGP